MVDPPFVSVILPVWNDAARLSACLAALAAQDYLAERFEILVVDNGSDDDPASVVAGVPGARLLVEPRPASDRARNTGVRAARGQVLAFTDSDCLPRPDWLRRGVERLAEHPPPGAAAGRIEVTARDPARPTPAELHDLALGFQQERCVRRSHYGATANLFVRRECYDAVGPFREDLTYGGDAEWGARARRLGHAVVYVPQAVVAHPARARVSDLVARTRRGAGGLVEWRRGRPLHQLAGLLKDLAVPPDQVWRILRTPALRGAFDRLRVLLLFLALRQVRFWERLRVLLGGHPLR